MGLSLFSRSKEKPRPSPGVCEAIAEAKAATIQAIQIRDKVLAQCKAHEKSDVAKDL